MDIEREAFEQRFPVPTGVYWSERAKDYTYESLPFLGACCSYSQMWKTWQAARQAPASGEVEPVAYLVECDGLRWAHAEHKDAEVQAMRLGADVTELFTHPPAKVPEKNLVELAESLARDVIHLEDCEDREDRWTVEDRTRNTAAEIQELLTTPTPATTPEAYPCWCCEELVSLVERSDCDGDCPHCGAELDLEDWPRHRSSEQ